MSYDYVDGFQVVPLVSFESSQELIEHLMEVDYSEENELVIADHGREFYAVCELKSTGRRVDITNSLVDCSIELTDYDDFVFPAKEFPGREDFTDDFRTLGHLLSEIENCHQGVTIDTQFEPELTFSDVADYSYGGYWSHLQESNHWEIHDNPKSEFLDLRPHMSGSRVDLWELVVNESELELMVPEAVFFDIVQLAEWLHQCPGEALNESDYWERIREAEEEHLKEWFYGSDFPVPEDLADEWEQLTENEIVTLLDFLIWRRENRVWGSFIDQQFESYYYWDDSELAKIREWATGLVAANSAELLKLKIEWFGFEVVSQEDYEIKFYDTVGNYWLAEWNYDYGMINLVGTVGSRSFFNWDDLLGWIIEQETAHLAKR